MLLPLMLAAAGFAYQGQYSQPLDVPQPIRMELTPTLDGTINKEEWDPFGPQTFMQWEPGRIFAAAQMPVGKDLVLSIDGKGDGWLVGRDNLEFRVSVKDGKAVVTVRELDATVVRAPVWRDRKDLEAASAATTSTTGDVVTVEAMFDDAGLKVLPRAPTTMLLRLDIVDANVNPASYEARVCSPIRFDVQRTAALPKGMDSGVEAMSRRAIPGENLALRFTFHGSNALGTKTLELRSLGEAEAVSNRLSILFPSFDNKGRAFVDYKTRIDPAATSGYRIVRGTMSFKDGPPANVEASYRIAPFFDFDLVKTDFDRLPDSNILQLAYLLHGYSYQASEGIVRIEPPTGWQVGRGEGARFKLVGNQTFVAHNFELHVPADAHGTFPIKLTGQTKDRSVSQVCYVTIR